MTIAPPEEEVHVCSHESCASTDTMPCYLGGEREPDDWYCDDHISAAGFCKGCGMFSVGIESFDFSAIPGFCAECVDFIHTEEAMEDEFDDDDWGEGEYPF